MARPEPSLGSAPPITGNALTHGMPRRSPAAWAICFRAAVARRLGDLFPGCPSRERQTIAAHACQKHSGRIGRSAAAKQFDVEALELAVRAHIRHSHTSYDELLAGGVDRSEARATVRGAVDDVVERWTPSST